MLERLQSTTAYSVKILASIVVGVWCACASAQRLTVVLDPARGGTEDGARIDEHTTEKQVTLDVANRLRLLLQARDFDVVQTRDADALVTNDGRAAVANQSKAVACLLLHATAAGKGLHLFTSSLPQAAPQAYAVPWDEAQAAYAQRSQRLEGELATAFGRAKIAVSGGHTWIRPLDNMECPAVAIEIAPDGEGATAADHAYQGRIAETIAGALLFWRGHADVVQSIVAPVPVVEPKAAVPGTAEGGKVSAAVPGTAVPGRGTAGRVPAGTAPRPVTPNAVTPKLVVPPVGSPAGTLPPGGKALGTTPKPAGGRTDPAGVSPKVVPARPVPAGSVPE